MKKRFFIFFLTITLALISVGVYASESLDLSEMDIWVPCNDCGTDTLFELIESQQYEKTATEHRVYDYYEGTCSGCGNSMHTYFYGQFESHSFTHIYKEINGSYVELDKCTGCGYEVYNNFN